MNGGLNKRYDFPIIVSAYDLKSLKEMLSSGFVEFQYDINTKDGARYTLNSLEDVLNYSNPDGRKIQRICIKGYKKKGESFLYPNISVSLLDKSKHVKSCELEMYQLEETEICYYSQRIDEFVNRVKAPYWWLHKSAFYWIVGIVLYVLLGIFYILNTNNTESSNRVYNILVLQGVSIFCMFFSLVVLEKIVFYFFPAGCFAIGEQKKHKDKLDKRKKLVFVTIILALVVGVLSSIIAYYVVRGLA